MGSFLVLECKKCGAHLEFADKRDIYYCEHCGAKHLYENIKSGSIDESYASCPLCKRNDRARKITTFSEGFSPPSKPLKVSEEFKPPYNQTVRAIFLLIFEILLSGGVVISSLNIMGDINPLGIIILTGVFLPCYSILIISAIKFLIEGKKSDPINNQKAQEQWEKDKRRYEQVTPVFDRILELWDELYYCGRDDIVFICGYRDHTTKDNMNEFIEKKALEEVKKK